MRFCSTLLAGLLLAACSGVEMKPGDRSHRRQEVPPGPGLLSGEQGEFVIFRYEVPAEKEETASENEQDTPKSEAPN